MLLKDFQIKWIFFFGEKGKKLNRKYNILFLLLLSSQLRDFLFLSINLIGCYATFSRLCFPPFYNKFYIMIFRREFFLFLMRHREIIFQLLSRILSQEQLQSFIFYCKLFVWFNFFDCITKFYFKKCSFYMQTICNFFVISSFINVTKASLSLEKFICFVLFVHVTFLCFFELHLSRL